jgi:hypothetical protein
MTVRLEVACPHGPELTCLWEIMQPFDSHYFLRLIFDLTRQVDGMGPIANRLAESSTESLAGNTRPLQRDAMTLD